MKGDWSIIYATETGAKEVQILWIIKIRLNSWCRTQFRKIGIIMKCHTVKAFSYRALLSLKIPKSQVACGFLQDGMQ